MMRSRRRSRLRGLLAAPVIVVAAMLVASAPASAVLIDPTSGPHHGNYGAHALIDSFEFKTVCKYSADHHLKKILIRRPIVYGFDRTNHLDTQKVGWRYTIEYADPTTTAGGLYEDWPDWYASPFVKATATDQDNATFSPPTYTFTSDPTSHFVYRVSVTMRWYYPDNTTMDGSAVHVVWWYLGKDPTYLDSVSAGGCTAVSGSVR